MHYTSILPVLYFVCVCVCLCILTRFMELGKNRGVGFIELWLKKIDKDKIKIFSSCIKMDNFFFFLKLMSN